MSSLSGVARFGAEVPFVLCQSELAKNPQQDERFSATMNEGGKLWGQPIAHGCGSKFKATLNLFTLIIACLL